MLTRDHDGSVDAGMEIHLPDRKLTLNLTRNCVCFLTSPYVHALCYALFC